MLRFSLTEDRLEQYEMPTGLQTLFHVHNLSHIFLSREIAKAPDADNAVVSFLRPVELLDRHLMNLNLSGNVLAHLRRLLEHLDVMEVVPQDLVVAPNAGHQFQDFALPE